MPANFSNSEEIWKQQDCSYIFAKPPSIPNSYARLTKGTMGKWFTKDGVLKENYIQIVDCGTTMKNLRHNMYELEENPKLRDEMVW